MDKTLCFLHSQFTWNIASRRGRFLYPFMALTKLQPQLHWQKWALNRGSFVDALSDAVLQDMLLAEDVS